MLHVHYKNWSNKESLKFRERIHSNIYGLRICLLPSQNMIFVKFLIQIIKQRTQFSYYTIKRVRLDNIDGFTSQIFDDYCMVTKIEENVHT